VSAAQAQPLVRGAGLQGLATPPCQAYDLAMLDLDGVVYIGRQPVPGAADQLRAAKAEGMRTAFITNNASRPPEAIARVLVSMGIDAQASDVVTSAQAVARLMAADLPAGATVLVVGGEGLLAALAEHGLRSVDSADAAPDAVVQGFSPDLGWRGLCEAAVAVSRGLPWYASNTDHAIPTPRGRAPGNGAFVDAVRAAAGGYPVVAGKPEPALFEETLRRIPARSPLVVGDRLDTDILGAVRVGCPSLLVMTGVTDLAGLLSAPPDQRPSYVGHDLSSLLRPHPAPDTTDGAARCGGWEAAADAAGQLTLAGNGTADDGLRALAAAGWGWYDTHTGDLDSSAAQRRLAAAASEG
jgi:glycerol 3-phosphatase-2